MDCITNTICNTTYKISSPRKSLSWQGCDIADSPGEAVTDDGRQIRQYISDAGEHIVEALYRAVLQIGNDIRHRTAQRIPGIYGSTLDVVPQIADG